MMNLLVACQAMEGAGHRPDAGLLTRLSMGYADVMREEAREMEMAAAGPPEDWGVEREMSGEGLRRGTPGEIDGDFASQ